MYPEIFRIQFRKVNKQLSALNYMQELIKVKMSKKGEIVIPKKVREKLGFSKNKILLLEVKGKIAQLRTTNEEDVIKNWEKIAKESKVDVSKWIYGDRLYEEVF